MEDSGSSERGVGEFRAASCLRRRPQGRAGNAGSQTYSRSPLPGSAVGSCFPKENTKLCFPPRFSEQASRKSGQFHNMPHSQFPIAVWRQVTSREYTKTPLWSEVSWLSEHNSFYTKKIFCLRKLTSRPWEQ